MMMLSYIKQHLSNIWSSIYEKVKQHWDWAEKKALLIKKSESKSLRFFIIKDMFKAILKTLEQFPRTEV